MRATCREFGFSTVRVPLWWLLRRIKLQESYFNATFSCEKANFRGGTALFSCTHIYDETLTEPPVQKLALKTNKHRSALLN